MKPIDGRTRLAGIFGDPVEHTFSPPMQNAAFEERGLNVRYLPFHITGDRLGAAVESIRALGMLGVNVTVPHKQAVIPFLDEIDREAEAIGAVNTIVNRDGRLVGYNTDGRGFVRSLKEVGVEVQGKTIVVLGAGGASRAVAASLLFADAGEMVIINRTADKAEALCDQLRRINPNVNTAPWESAAHIREADIVVQTTSLGLKPGDPMPADPVHLREGQVVCDLIYNPEVTPFMTEASRHGAQTVGGLGMLLWQGALAFELWTGVEPPVEVMREALAKVIGR